LFFQAEDGIRGRNVTGIQTCALPISEDGAHGSGGGDEGGVAGLRAEPHHVRGQHCAGMLVERMRLRRLGFEGVEADSAEPAGLESGRASWRERGGSWLDAEARTRTRA